MKNGAQSELLPCPFCGLEPEKRMGYDWGKFGCGNWDCLIRNISFYPEQWNKRDIQAARTQTPPAAGFDYERVHAWMTNPNRKAANLAFTEGENRNAAYLIEDYDDFCSRNQTPSAENNEAAKRELVESIAIIQGVYAHAARQGRSYKAQALIEINDAIATLTKATAKPILGE